MAGMWQFLSCQPLLLNASDNEIESKIHKDKLINSCIKAKYIVCKKKGSIKSINLDQI